jgi:hypothetical protein
MAEDLLYRARMVLFEAADLLLELRQACAALARTLDENRRVGDGTLGPPWRRGPEGPPATGPPFDSAGEACNVISHDDDPVTPGAWSAGLPWAGVTPPR